jgi:pentatricopeptide repeat protein
MSPTSRSNPVGSMHISNRKVFVEMDGKDLVSWNTIIQCYAENLCDEEALAHFRAMMKYAECHYQKRCF